MELKVISVIWNSSKPMTVEALTQALFPVHQTDRRRERVIKEIRSLLRKNAIAAVLDFESNHKNDTFIPLLSREQYVAYYIKRLSCYGLVLGVDEAMTALGEFLRRLRKKGD